ncbi:MAG: hypothetical protein ACAI35_02295 [Candidatus Methylacidiphilales bacterium]
MLLRHRHSTNTTAPRASGFAAFSLLELLVSMAVLALLMLLISRLLSSALTATGMGNKHMDADAQARAVLDRLGIDLGQMVRRPDVDYFLKDATHAPQPGNDQLAFFSEVPGYSASGFRSTVSLVGYRVNSEGASPAHNRLQRMGSGLAWNGASASASEMPLVFSASPTSFAPNAISTHWPAATTMAAADSYELAGPQIFRIEYFYVLKGTTAFNPVTATFITLPAQLSDTPWDTRAPLNHTTVAGMRDVAAVTVMIAVMDPHSRVQVTDAQLNELIAAMPDFADTMQQGELERRWQQAITDAATASALPQEAAASIRIYRRCFQLAPSTAGSALATP